MHYSPSAFELHKGIPLLLEKQKNINKFMNDSDQAIRTLLCQVNKTTKNVG